MNREIQELREVITKLVPLLTGRGLKVTQRGTQAYVQANPRTNKPEVVNIPSIPDNASPDFISAVAGFVDHEVAHVLFTDWKFYGGDGVKLDKFSPEGQALINSHNIIEDTMIEREIVKAFPGSQRNLDKLHHHFLEKITTPAISAAKGNEKQEFAYLMVPMMRALSGQEIFQEFMDKNGYWKHPMVENLHMALSDESLEMIKTAKTTQQTLDVALEIHDILFHRKKREEEEEAKKQQEKQQEKQKQKGKSQDKPEKEAGQGDGTGERKHTKEESGEEGESQSGGEESGEAEGEESENAKASGKPKKGKPEPEEPEETEEEAAGSGAGEGEEPEEAEDEAECQGSGSGAGEEEDEESEEEGAGSKSEEEPEDEEEGEAAGDGGSDEDEDEESEDEGSQIGEGQSGEEEDYEDITGNQSGGEDEEGQGGPDHTGAGGESGKSMFEMDPSEFKPIDLSSAIAQEIQQMAAKAVGESDYSVFTKDEDRIEVFVPDEKNMRDNWVPELDEKVGGLIGPMQKEIERLMAARSLSVRTAGHRAGRLHSPSLYRVLQNDPRVFQRKEEHQSKDTAVMLLVDNSGSMNGAKMATAMQASYALAQTLERVNIPNEIIGFTTGSLSHAAVTQYHQETAKGIRFCRASTIVMPVYKQFSERVTPAVKRRIAYQVNVQYGLNNNTDGESLEYAALRLIPRRERRKVMLVLSDGQPVGSGSGWHLKDTVKKLTKMGIETVGIGINSNAVENFYPRSMVLNRVEDLPVAVMGELKRILTT